MPQLQLIYPPASMPEPFFFMLFTPKIVVSPNYGTARFLGIDTSLMLHVDGPRISQHTSVAPPVSIASISSCVKGALRNRCGSSFRSKYSPLAGATEPRE